MSTGLIVAVVPTVIGFAAAVTALWKVARFIFRVDAALPALLKIAEEFSGNSGQESLRDVLQHITDRADENEIANKWAVRVAEDSRLIANTNAKIVEELTNTQTTELLSFREYIHEKMHEIDNKLGVVNMQASVNEKRAASIEDRLDKLTPFIKRHREDYEEDESETGISDD